MWSPRERLLRIGRLSQRGWASCATPAARRARTRAGRRTSRGRASRGSSRGPPPSTAPGRWRRCPCCSPTTRRTRSQCPGRAPGRGSRRRGCRSGRGIRSCPRAAGVGMTLALRLTVARRVQHARAVGADETHAGAPADLGQPSLELDALGAGLTETGRDDHQRRARPWRRNPRRPRPLRGAGW